MTEHTPTPWRYKENAIYHKDEPVADAWGFSGVDAEKDAHHIVRCVNYHDQLVEALREVLPDIASSEVCGHMLRYDGVKDLLTELEQQK